MRVGLRRVFCVVVLAVSVSLLAGSAFGGDGQKPGDPIPLPIPPPCGPSGG